MREHGPWTVQKTTQQYQNSFITVVEDQVIQPDGQSGTYATVTMKRGVAILPLDDHGTVYLTRQFRYALGNESIEVVCGGVDGGEPFLEAAQREIHEELGIEAAEWQDLGIVNLDTSIVHCRVQLFLAKQLNFQEPEQEGTEAIAMLQMPLQEAIQQVINSQITHAPSCILLLKAGMLLKGQ